MSDFRIQYLVERYAEGRITQQEQTELDILRAEQSEVDRLIVAEQELRSLIADAPKPALKPFFEQRVMERVRAERIQASKQNETGFFDVDLSAALSRLFPRVALPAFAVSGLAMASNASAATSGSTLVETLFALPTIDVALTLLV
ncbi:MAG: hypothetical protein AAGE37_02945 [Pseudomonadota bacterium]